MKHASIQVQNATGASADTQTSNGIKPNQEIENFFTKIGIPTQFSKIPNFQKLKHKLCIIRK